MASVLADDTVEQDPTQFEPLDQQQDEEDTIDLSGDLSGEDPSAESLHLQKPAPGKTTPPAPNQLPPDSWELSDGDSDDKTQDEQLTAFEEPQDQDESATELFMDLDKPADLGRHTELEPFSDDLPVPGSSAGGDSSGDSSGPGSGPGSGDAVAADPGPTPVESGFSEPNIRAVEDDPNKPPTLHGGDDAPLTRLGADSFTRHEEVTPALPSDSDEKATIELDQKIKELWRGVEAEGGSSSPSATLRVDNMPHLDSDSVLSVSERPIAYPEAESGGRADYRIEKFIAKGGMGRVYLAQQTSLGRTVALKTLSDDLSKKNRYRRKFFAEASITGRLDHPNIVPIHDLGVRGDGVPFYSMKLVTGEAWDKSIKERGKTENVNILLRVADAMAFAHSKQILHRDLKPENVMLGEYGEVLVVDWGLAIHLERDREFALGGTPLYMAPEMANHDVPLIGVRSDVYLMGAMLYELLEGKAPHASGAKTATERLLVAAMNQIEPYESVDELIDVALKAMATNPSDRYQTVVEFQDAIKECQRHADSRDRSERAAKELQEARATGDNEGYSRAVFAFQDAIELWPENGSARDGLRNAKLAYAENALENQDYALGLSLLDPSEPEHQTVYKQLTDAQQQEQSRGRRLKIARVAAMSATLATVVSLVVFAFYANNAREKQAALTTKAEDNAREANRQKGIAEDNAMEAIKQQDIAEDNAKEALRQKGIAEDNAEEAIKQQGIAEDNANEAQRQQGIAEDNAKEALRQQSIAEKNADEAKRRAFAVQLTLTATELAAYDTDSADNRLRALETDSQYSQLLDWEADRLRYLAHRDFDREQLDGTITAFAPAPGGEGFASLSAGRLKLGRFDAAGGGVTIDQAIDHRIESPRCVALGPGNLFAVGGAAVGKDAPLVELGPIDQGNKRVVLKSRGPNWKITALAFSPDGQQLAVARHSPLAVRIQMINVGDSGAQLDPKLDTPQEYILSGVGAFEELAFSADGLRLAAAEASGETRQSNVTVWSRDTPSGAFTSKVKLPAAVRSVAFHPHENSLLACGGVGGELLLWTIEPSGDPAAADSPGAAAQPNVARFDRHTDDITRVAFSPSGDSLVTASASGVALVWSRSAESGEWAVDARPPLRHGSPLRGSSWAAGGETLVTADAEGTVRTWPLDQYYNVRRWSTSAATPAHTIAAAPQDRFVVVGDNNGHTQLFNAQTGDKRPLGDFFIGHTGGSIAKVWSRSGGEASGRDPLLTLGFDRGQATLYSWGTDRRTSIPAIDAKQSFDLSPNGQQLAVAGLQKLRLLDARSGKPLATSGLSVASMAFLPTGSQLAVGDARGRLLIYSTAGGKLQRTAVDTIATGSELRWLSATRSAGGSVLYAASDDAQPIVYRVELGGGLSAFTATSLPPLDLPVRGLSAAGDTVVALCGERGMLYGFRAGASAWVQLAESEINSAAALPGGGVIAAGADGRLRYWTANGFGAAGDEGQGALLPAPAGATYDRVGLLASGKAYASGRRDGRPVVDLWQPATNQSPTATYESRSPVMLAVPAPPVGDLSVQQIATLSRDGLYRRWNAKLPAGQPDSPQPIVPGGTEIIAAQASADNRVLAAIAKTGDRVTAHLLQSPESQWQELKLPAGEVLSDLASCAVQGDRMVVWDARQNKLFDWRLAEARGPQLWQGPPAAANPSDSLPVAIGPQGQVALVLATAQGKQIALRSDAGEVRRSQLKQSSITSLAFSPSGNRLLAGGGSGAIRLYDISQTAAPPPADAEDANSRPTQAASLTELATFTEHRRPVISLRFSATGESLLSGDSQGQVILWPSDPRHDVLSPESPRPDDPRLGSATSSTDTTLSAASQ